jgi:hypothetical protein
MIDRFLGTAQLCLRQNYSEESDLMSQNPLEFEEETEAIYESLISLIENSQGQLAPIVVGCDEERLRERVIERYEREAKSAKVQPYRVMLGAEPSLRAGLAEVVEREVYLQEGGEAVFTVLGANTLLWVKLRDEDTQSEIEKFYGYLQWTREGLREFRYSHSHSSEVRINL